LPLQRRGVAKAQAKKKKPLPGVTSMPMAHGPLPTIIVANGSLLACDQKKKKRRRRRKKRKKDNCY
jgi:hypothetical protein